ncbi:acyl-CoA dehydrogenase family protein [Pedobacter jejuensis]|uniref:Cyclohex-1-ene-1-carbonyl-CoA dehydrogenase n=1 Tax=Pedobacter jejuensis TaxID=1268550 RepID=A0A3N0BXE8_9SPHI|nr:acyl-CoA dehydrogenase family protein [Pedobacter jejuensis]RNL54140.1 acyl-CoA dehydrogenase [Pedobacter jejuensis]
MSVSYNFSETETQVNVKAMVKDFAEKHIRPNIMEWDEAQTFPVELFKQLGELGLMGVLVPEEYGGSGLGYQEYVDVIVEVSRVCGSIGLSLAAHNSLCTGHILAFGNEEQKQKWLPKLATAEWIGAWGLTEANTGSDALRMMTTAVEDGDDYIINGAKNWITHGKSGDVAVVMVRTGEQGSSKGISAIVVERGTPGFSAGKKENKLGMRASETTEMIFDNCRVPKANLLGNIGDGFKQAMKILDGGRISIAALGLGIAKGAFDASVSYSKQRQQFGQPISSFQAISFKLADMATDIEAAELLIRQAADLKNRHLPMTKESAMAKYFSSEVAVRVSTEAVQIFGGYGYTKDFPVEKFYRDSKLCTIGEGTSEIQKIVIAREILSK